MEFTAELINPRISRELRRSVLSPLSARTDPLPGEGIIDAVHVGAFVNIFNLASTCFIYPDPCPWRPDEQPAWHLRQMATGPEHQGQGAGSAVLRTVLDYVAATGGGVLWCNARVPAVAFYVRHGLAVHGEEHVSGTNPPLPHLYMSRWVEPAPESAERTQRLAEIREQVVEAFDPDR